MSEHHKRHIFDLWSKVLSFGKIVNKFGFALT